METPESISFMSICMKHASSSVSENCNRVGTAMMTFLSALLRFLTEISGPGVSFECSEQRGMHINEDHFYAEVIDPKTGKETKVQRALRIAETQNGRKLRTRQVQSKRRKLTEKAIRMAEKGA